MHSVSHIDRKRLLKPKLIKKTFPYFVYDFIINMLVFRGR